MAFDRRASDTRHVIPRQLRDIRTRLREYFLLENAAKSAKSITESQRSLISAYQAAAKKRLSVARLLSTPDLTPVSLSLYRDSVLLLAMAFLTSDDGGVDVGEFDRSALLNAMDRTAKAKGLSTPSNFAFARSIFVDSHPFALDRLPPPAAAHGHRDLKGMTRWLSALIEVRSPHQVSLARIRRFAFAITCGVAILVWLGTQVLGPRNLALNKRTRSSVPVFDTAPQGVVDGEKNGRFGFHSSKEESPWLTIDLGRRHHISRIEVFGRGDCCFDVSVPLSVEASADGVLFRTLAERTTEFSESDPWIVIPDGLVARVIRLQSRNSFLVLSEVEVYGYLW